MSNLKQLGIPQQLQGVSPDVFVADINWSWSMTGAGNPIFWEIYQNAIYRDSTAKGVRGGALQNKTGVYALLGLGGVSYIPKADTEGRTRVEGKPGLMNCTVIAGRVDNRADQIPIFEGFDPTGMIWSAIQSGHQTWANHLPQQVLLRALVLGTDLYGNALPVAYDGKSLYATDHPVNPIDPNVKGPDGATTYSNIYQLKAKVDEGEFADTMDKVERVPDLNGLTLPNNGMMPTIVVASRKAAIRYRRFIGGPGATDQNAPIIPLKVGDFAIGIYSCSVGGATIIVDPYLYAISTDKAAAELTAYGFTMKGRPALLWREEQPPLAQISGPEKRYENKAVEIVSDARVGAGFGDPRSTFKIIEKAS